MNYKKYIYKDKNIKLILEEDLPEVGWYLIVFSNPASDVSNADYLYDSESLAFQGAEERFGIKKSQWTLIK